MSTWENVRTKQPAKRTPNIYEALVAAWNRRNGHFKSGDRESFCYAFGCCHSAMTNSMEQRAEWLSARAKFLSEDEHEPQ